MSFASLLRHTVHLERDVESGTLDDYGQPVTETEVGEDFKADLQPRNAREVAAISQAGVDVGEWKIYCHPRLIDADDKIIHDSSECPVAEVMDLPDATFEITAVRNATGRGHHLEIDARLVGAGIEGVAGS